MMRPACHISTHRNLILSFIDNCYSNVSFIFSSQCHYNIAITYLFRIVIERSGHKGFCYTKSRFISRI